MQIEKRSMNWLPRPSTYDYVNSQNAKRRESNDSFIASQNAVASTITNVMTNYSSGLSEIVARVSYDRVIKSA